MKNILNQLFNHETLDREQAREILINIAKETYNPSQVAAFITVYLMRSVKVEELAGFRDALLELCVPVNFNGQETIDLCGTGGDGKNTFNISTLSSFVVAGAGYKVTKHGNYGVSSVSGSSNVLEHFGFNFTNKEDSLKRQLDKTNICFLHAPLFHPAMKTVAPIRKQLGVKTFFNMLGPIVNPANPTHQIIGVFDLKIARLYQYLHQQIDRKHIILYALDGYDEISLTDNFKAIINGKESIFSPEDLNLERLNPATISGGNSIEDAAKIFMEVLNNEATKEQINVVLANSAMAIQCINPQSNFIDCLEEAKASIKDKKALQSFKKLLEMSK
jgi:anthranilate phosphoribosyltransferase